MSFGIQPIHILVVIVVALVIFGPKRLPELGRSVGKMISEFRKGTADITDAFRQGIKEQGNPATPSSPSLPNPAASPATMAFPSENHSIRPKRGGNFCIQCGAQNSPQAHYCNQCGSKLLDSQGRSA